MLSYDGWIPEISITKSSSADDSFVAFKQLFSVVVDGTGYIGLIPILTLHLDDHFRLILCDKRVLIFGSTRDTSDRDAY